MTDLATRTRITEYHDLIGRIAVIERNIRLSGYKPPADVAAEHKARLVRAGELAELINADQSADYDVSGHVERWIEAHPLAMTGAGMMRVIETAVTHPGGIPGNGVTVAVQIGDPTKGGRYYPLHAGMFVYVNGTLRLNLPDAVAEEFRQAGRRALQREVASLLAVESYR